MSAVVVPKDLRAWSMDALLSDLSEADLWVQLEDVLHDAFPRRIAVQSLEDCRSFDFGALSALASIYWEQGKRNPDTNEDPPHAVMWQALGGTLALLAEYAGGDA